MLWLILGAMTLAALGFLLLPLLRSRKAAPDRAEFDLEVYRDQLTEIDTEVERGTLASDEASAAKIEIERRMLRAGDARGPAKTGKAQGAVATAVALIVLVPAVAIAVYLQLGQPGMPSADFADRAPAAKTSNEQQQIAGMVGKLEAKLKQNPDDARGWSLLGRSYVVLGRYRDAVQAYGHATKLAPEDADVAMAYGETQVFAANGEVTPAAKTAFNHTLELSPKHPGARYYLALGRAQAGDMQGAFDMWRSLYIDSPPDAPWQSALQDRLREAASALKIDLATALPKPLPKVASSGAPGPSAADIQAAQQMTPDDRANMIRTMVGRLAAKMQQNPGDFDGWMRLGRAYGVLGESDKARDAYTHAVKLRPDDATAKQALAALGGEAAPAPAPAPAQAPAKSSAAAPGPTAADVAAAQQMSPQEQKAMIRSMVGRLAAKMEQDPGNFDGWMRLGHAYGVLGDNDKARAAFAKAVALRPNDATALTNEAGAMLGAQGASSDAIPAPAEALYRQALAVDPDNLDALWYVGIIEQQAGRPRVAAAHWRRLLGHLDPKGADYAEVNKRIAALSQK